MKTYDVKYKIGQQVYVIRFKSIIKGVIQSIEISDRKYNEEIGDVTVKYNIWFDNKNEAIQYDLYNENEVALNKEELIEKLIK